MSLGSTQLKWLRDNVPGFKEAEKRVKKLDADRDRSFRKVGLEPSPRGLSAAEPAFEPVAPDLAMTPVASCPEIDTYRILAAQDSVRYRSLA